MKLPWHHSHQSCAISHSCCNDAWSLLYHLSSLVLYSQGLEPIVYFVLLVWSGEAVVEFTYVVFCCPMGALSGGAWFKMVWSYCLDFLGRLVIVMYSYFVEFKKFLYIFDFFYTQVFF